MAGVDVVDGGAGDGAGQRRAGGRAGCTWSLSVDDDGGGHVDRPSQGREWCRPSAASAWPTAHGRGGAELARAPTPGCRSGSRSSARRRPRGRRAPRCARRDDAAGASIVAPIAVKKSRSGSVHLEPVGGRAEHQAADLVGVLAPDPLRHDRAHRVAGDDHLVEAEHVDQRAHVVGAVDQRELLASDPTPVPAQVERDHPEPSRQRLDRREPGQQPGAAQRVQQHDRRGTPGAGPGVSVTYVDPRPGSSTIRPWGMRAYGR